MVARGDLTSKFDVNTANLLIAGVNAGLHYALMFGVPLPGDVDEMHKGYNDTNEAMDAEIVKLLKQGGIVKDLLDYEDEEDES